MVTLAEDLGYGPDEKLLILNADDFGMCRSANVGISTLLAGGFITSATVMMPCGWAPQAVGMAKQNTDFDIGVHLTFTSEWGNYKWGPVTTARAVPSLVDPDGYFPAESLTVELRATDEDVRTEITAQFDRAVALGLQPTHADNHMGSLYGVGTGRSFLRVTLEECAARGLPFRLPRYADGLTDDPAQLATIAERLIGYVALADELGVVIPDYLWSSQFHLDDDETYESVRGDWMDLIRAVRPGVTEIYMHPFAGSPEMADISDSWRKREYELRLFADPAVREVLERNGIRLIGWRELQRLQSDRTQLVG